MCKAKYERVGFLCLQWASLWIHCKKRPCRFPSDRGWPVPVTPRYYYALHAFQKLEPLANRCAMRSSSCKILLNGKEDTDLVAKRELVLYVTLPILRFACVGINFVRWALFWEAFHSACRFFGSECRTVEHVLYSTYWTYFRSVTHRASIPRLFTFSSDLQVLKSCGEQINKKHT